MTTATPRARQSVTVRRTFRGGFATAGSYTTTRDTTKI
jgi:hypothetical protein